MSIVLSNLIQWIITNYVFKKHYRSKIIFYKHIDEDLKTEGKIEMSDNNIEIKEYDTQMLANQLVKTSVKYKNILKKYYKITLKNIDRFHVLYDYQLYNHGQMAKDLDLIDTHIDQAVNKIEDSMVNKFYENQETMNSIATKLRDDIVEEIGHAECDIKTT